MKFAVISIMSMNIISCMSQNEVDQKHAENITGVTFPPYFKDIRITEEVGMGLIFTIQGELPEEKLQDFISRFNISYNNLSEVESLPISFNAYNDADWWVTEDQRGLYGFKKGQKKSWSTEYHIHARKEENKRDQFLVRILYFEEPKKR